MSTRELAGRLEATESEVTVQRVRDVVDEVADGGLLKTWVENHGRDERIKQVRCGVEAGVIVEAIGGD